MSITGPEDGPPYGSASPSRTCSPLFAATRSWRRAAGNAPGRAVHRRRAAGRPDRVVNVANASWCPTRRASFDNQHQNIVPYQTFRVGWRIRGGGGGDGPLRGCARSAARTCATIRAAPPTRPAWNIAHGVPAASSFAQRPAAEWVDGCWRRASPGRSARSAALGDPHARRAGWFTDRPSGGRVPAWSARRSGWRPMPPKSARRRLAWASTRTDPARCAGAGRGGDSRSGRGLHLRAS